MARKIIIDTDPGQDDAVAILMALASPELEVLGVVAVAGNVPLALTEKNVRKTLELAGRTDVPVFAGCDRPLVRPLVTAEYVHGKTGLDGPDLPEPEMPLQAKHGVDFIIDTLRAARDDGITLCALGPLTNIATALQRAPDIAPRIREIVSMGGGLFEGGNTTPAAEFNIHVDPQAARIVFRCGRPVTLIPLDLTHHCLTTAKRIERFRRMGTRTGTATAALLDFFERFDEHKYGTDGGPLHDPNVIAWLLKPELYSGRMINVEVECASELTMGMTVADWWGVTGRPANVHYLRWVDDEGFYALLTERIARLP
ncbi:nucleoside hydrolase [Halovulum dunhuangense]|uniref:Nucleoside hydrolase n=1 Tax=Halovulum dunhuangense TaxID=1505036 RepID=A0A849KZA2_9RHOB|nr:nucleoside hydrolase [Halovulum dunhuangense]NNU78844.1 nucleoside hydrolase [Halovulum dunhuangense]